MTKPFTSAPIAKFISIFSAILLLSTPCAHGQTLSKTKGTRHINAVETKDKLNKLTVPGIVDSLSAYIGKYAVSPDFILSFEAINGELTAIPRGQAPISIIRISTDVFADKNNKKVQMEFVRNADGAVEKVILDQDGQKMEAQRVQPHRVNPKHMFSVEQLKSDLAALKKILNDNHPRPYEFTSETTFQHCFDSLSAAISRPMDEITFRYLLMPLVAKVHCGHTRLDPSVQLQQTSLNKFPPFVLYYEGERAFVRYSANKKLPLGAEIKSINGMPITKRIHNLLERVTGDGIHPNVQYNLINQPMAWFLYEMPFWYQIDQYNLVVADSIGQQRKLNLAAVDEATFKAQIPPPHRQHQLHLLKDKKLAMLSYPNLDFPDTSFRNRFLEETFVQLKSKGIDRLIIDVRGNGGGDPHNAAYLLKYLIPHAFTYSNSAPLSYLADLQKPITPAANHFKGHVYLLIDGGCFSSTGHLLSLLRYHHIGTFIGETTSASYSCNTNGVPYTLPNTGITLFCPKYIYETAVSGFQRADGISPDHEIITTFEDILSGKDRILEYAVSVASKGQ